MRFPAIPEERREAVKLWHSTYWPAERHAECARLNFRAFALHFNPEYYLEDWSDTMLEFQKIEGDVHGWALRTLELEQASCMDGRTPTRDDMLRESQSQYFLIRFQAWCEARLAFHRTALRLTFYGEDPLAGKEPIASSLERLRRRFADWRDTRLNERNALYQGDARNRRELARVKDSTVFTKVGIENCLLQSWIEREGLNTGTIRDERIEWLCWLQLIAPLSREWRPHESGLAILKKFAGTDYRRRAEQWWKRAPKKLTYLLPAPEDDFGTAVTKRIFPIEFCNWKAGYFDKRLRTKSRFTSALSKSIAQLGISYQTGAGRRGGMESDDEAEAFKPQTNLGQSADLETDKPKGWLFASRITS